MAEDALLAELQALRDRVVGITDTALASRDGLIITADTVDINPDNLAALAAASQGLAQRMAAEAGKGALREALTRGSAGCVAVYPVGQVALLAVVGDEGLDTSRLHRESRVTVQKLAGLLGGAGPGQAHAAAS
jgi:predicted regulator of Ras-like GTPase activity (Roadblock/LC7/MglB family)